jgi:hypothetical protein
MSAGADSEQNKAARVAEVAPIIIDLGKKKRKLVKKLRKGRGDLMERVHDVMGDLRTSGTLTSGNQPVVVIVREKKQRRARFGLF